MDSENKLRNAYYEHAKKFQGTPPVGFEVPPSMFDDLILNSRWVDITPEYGKRYMGITINVGPQHERPKLINANNEIEYI